MKHYKARPGVLLLDVCGEKILVATGDARDECPNVTHINASGAVLWEIVLEEKTPDRILPRAAERLSLSQTEALVYTLRFTKKLLDNGYLLWEEDA